MAATEPPQRQPAMKWLRLYHEARNDAKLESLPDDEFRVWHRLLCFAGEQPERGLIAGFTPRLLAVEVARGDVALLQRALASLVELRIIDESGNGHCFLNWKKRQHPSDNVTARVMKHRESKKKQDETLQKRYSNGDVTECNALEGEGEGEGDTELEIDTYGGGVEPARGKFREVPGSSHAASAASDSSIITLCERIADKTKLPRKPAVMERLAEIIASHQARGLSGEDIWREVLKLTDTTRKGYSARASVSNISNWLEHASPSSDGSANGYSGRNSRPRAAAPSAPREPPMYTRTPEDVVASIRRAPALDPASVTISANGNGNAISANGGIGGINGH